jgi:hypothetical protein
MEELFLFLEQNLKSKRRQGFLFYKGNLRLQTEFMSSRGPERKPSSSSSLTIRQILKICEREREFAAHDTERCHIETAVMHRELWLICRRPAGFQEKSYEGKNFAKPSQGKVC